MFSSTNWEYVSLSDPETVKFLIMFRSELDPAYKIEERKLLESSTDLANVNQNIQVAYIDLMNVMEKVKFTKRQQEYIAMMEMGMNENDIALKIRAKNPNRVLEVMNRICEMVSEKNREIWDSWIRWDYKRVDTDYKKCSKCGEFKPKNIEYFRKDSRNLDGLQGRCRKCE